MTNGELLVRAGDDPRFGSAFEDLMQPMLGWWLVPYGRYCDA